jgi:hypothetical protein
VGPPGSKNAANGDPWVTLHYEDDEQAHKVVVARFAERFANRAITSGEDKALQPTMWSTLVVRVRTRPLVCVRSDSGARTRLGYEM